MINYILLFFLGFTFSFLGSITPSMLNMAALKISIEKGRKASNNYALGVSFVVFTQVFIAVFLTKYITQNPTILESLEKAGIIIFVLLSFYFYKESKKGKIKVEGIKNKKESTFITGATLSLLNMFAIPFFCGVIVFLEAYNLFSFDFIAILFFNIGSVLGTFYILFLYGKFAKNIQKKTGKLTKDINLVLSILTGLVAIFTVIKLFFKI